MDKITTFKNSSNVAFSYIIWASQYIIGFILLSLFTRYTRGFLDRNTLYIQIFTTIIRPNFFVTEGFIVFSLIFFYKFCLFHVEVQNNFRKVSVQFTRSFPKLHILLFSGLRKCHLQKVLFIRKHPVYYITHNSSCKFSATFFV